MNEELVSKYLKDIDELGFAKTLTLTTEQTAQILNISTRVLGNWRKDNSTDLPYKKIGKSYVYTKRDVAEFLARS